MNFFAMFSIPVLAWGGVQEKNDCPRYVHFVIINADRALAMSRCSYTAQEKILQHTGFIYSFHSINQLKLKCDVDSCVRKYTHSNAIRSTNSKHGVINTQTNSDRCIIPYDCGKKGKKIKLTAWNKYQVVEVYITLFLILSNLDDSPCVCVCVFK